MTGPEGAPTPEEIDAFMRATVLADWWNDHTVSMLEDRITDLEEIVAARWPRSVFVARRLRRKIRVSIGPFFPGASFAVRRAEAVGNELATQERRSGRRQGGAA